VRGRYPAVVLEATGGQQKARTTSRRDDTRESAHGVLLRAGARNHAGPGGG